MGVCYYIGITLMLLGIVLIVSDLIKINRHDSKDTSNEPDTDIQFLDIIKLKGGRAIILTVLGFLLVVLNSGLPSMNNLTTTSNPSAEITSVWYEHNAQEGNLLGMRIHMMYNTQNLKGENCVASAYFYSSAGEALKDYNQLYKTYDGSVSAGIPFTPYSADTFGDHLIIFIPYNELHMSPGSYQLKFNLVIWHGSTKLAESYLTSFNFVQY